MSLHANELNYLVYRYLLEQGYEHAAFSFFNELDISKFAPDPQNVPKGLLVALLQKSLQLLDIEMHIDSKGQLHACNKPFQLFEPHSCSTVHLINQTLQRYDPLFLDKSQNKESLSNLPTPILFTQSDILQKVYLQPQIDQLEQIKLESLTNEILESKFTSNQEEIQQNDQKSQQEKYLSEMKISALSIDFLLEKLNSQMSNITIDTQDQFFKYQKQIQLNQNQILDQDTLLKEDVQQYISFSAFIKATSSSISAIQTNLLEKILKVTEQNKQHLCTCENVFCECDLLQKDEDAKDVKNIECSRIIIFGDQVGQAFIIIFNDQQQFISGNIITSNIQNSDIVSIHLMQNRNRFIISQSDGTINIFKLNILFDDNTMIPEILQIYSGKPFGSLLLSQTMIQEGRQFKTYLIAYGSTSSPYLLQLNTMIASRMSTSFITQSAEDGVEYLLLNSCYDELNIYSASVTCLCLIGDFIISARSDNLLLISELGKEGIKIQLENRPQIITELNGNAYIFTDTLNCYEYNIQQNKISEFQVDQVVLSAISLPQGVAYISGNHVFLLGGIENGIPLIKLDWIMPNDVNFIIQEGDFINAISKGMVYQIDIKNDDFQERQIFKLAEIQTFDSCQDSIVYGSSSGGISIQLRWPIQK
ncbi:LisH domain-containing protein [Spironucleus salmonicida]|uniref:LisH domain-containing protein n=1 Tax=Spironucleus salmonicida TaxID=348837 RepID=V6LRG8_9EUKA|nr:LisH domain-containing protein [Spironucleus salmonicida]|eukprot:EST46291.1 LisH domain-containing protein [Spironucleus salmonicida]